MCARVQVSNAAKNKKKEAHRVQIWTVPLVFSVCFLQIQWGLQVFFLFRLYEANWFFLFLHFIQFFPQLMHEKRCALSIFRTSEEKQVDSRNFPLFCGNFSKGWYVYYIKTKRKLQEIFLLSIFMSRHLYENCLAVKSVQIPTNIFSTLHSLSLSPKQNTQIPNQYTYQTGPKTKSKTRNIQHNRQNPNITQSP